MAVVAVICEYNLFHHGHKLLFDRLRAHFGPETVILSLMSGHFTQRGLFACTDKYTRAQAALLCGCDLVLELPVPYCCGVAERFAMGGVGLLEALGGVDYLAFGSECGDLSRLIAIAENRRSPRFTAALKEALLSAPAKESYIQTCDRVYRSLYGAAALPPNDTLGVEYINALHRTKSLIKPYAVHREGGTTATETRRIYLEQGAAGLAGLVPEEALAVFEGAERSMPALAQSAVLWTLRNASPERLCTLADMNADLAHRLINGANKTGTLEECLAACTSKTYTRARVSRCLLYAVLGITPADFEKPPSYTLMLACNRKGRALLSAFKRNARISVYTKGAQVPCALAARADALYTLSLERRRDAGAILRKSPFLCE